MAVRIVRRPPRLQPENPPKKSAGREYGVAAEFQATDAAMRKVMELHEQSDDLGPCLVSHFNFSGVGLFFYRSKQYPAKLWMTHVDVNDCVSNRVKPSAVVRLVLEYLQLKVSPWLNDELDDIVQSKFPQEIAKALSVLEEVGAEKSKETIHAQLVKLKGYLTLNLNDRDIYAAVNRSRFQRSVLNLVLDGLGAAYDLSALSAGAFPAQDRVNSALAIGKIDNVFASTVDQKIADIVFEVAFGRGRKHVRPSVATVRRKGYGFGRVEPDMGTGRELPKGGADSANLDTVQVH